VVETLSFKELNVTAIVTGGIETNGGRAGDPADYYKPQSKPVKYGTINIMLLLDCDMPEGVMARALVTCTEAKTAAIQELLEGSKYSNGIATGSGTDQTIIIANSASELYMEGAGKHSKLGELIGKTVKNAVKKALAKQSGLTPAKQHDVFRRLKRFDIKPGDMWQAYSAQDAAVVKPEYLLAAEKLAKEDIMLVYTSLYAHLLDQHLWELISDKEMQLAGQKLLQAIAEQYNVEAEIINEGTLASMLASWQQQFNKIIAQRLHQTAKES
jgi:adenosylcobinamide hydrolase